MFGSGQSGICRGHGLGTSGMVFSDESIHIVIRIVQIDSHGIDVQWIFGHVHTHILNARPYRTAFQRVYLFLHACDVYGCFGT